MELEAHQTQSSGKHDHCGLLQCYGMQDAERVCKFRGLILYNTKFYYIAKGDHQCTDSK